MGFMVRRALGYLYEMGFPALIALAVFWLCWPWRKRRLAEKHLASGKAREVVLALFVAFCAGLAALTLFPSGFWDLYTRLQYDTSLWSGFRTWPEIVERLELLPDMLTPFQGITRTFRTGLDIQWLLLLGNIVMLAPLGFFPALLWRRWTWWKSLLVGFCSSFLIEFTQFFIGRFTDIDDVILNTTGALVGYGLYRLFRRLWPGLAQACQVQEV